MKLEQLGWDSFFESHFKPFAEKELYPARVALEFKNQYQLYSQFGEVPAEMSGKLRHEAVRREDLPAVGDWVVIRYLQPEHKALIVDVLPRKSKFVRKAPGDTADLQILASNIDTVFLVTGLDRDFNLRRLERYLTLAWNSGASPVVLLNKADLCEDLEKKVSTVERVAIDVPVLAISAKQDVDLSLLYNYFGEGETAVLLGSSGVGKSTIINRLLGEQVQAVQEVRDRDGRGRHTTTHRALFMLPKGGMIIDTPGLREIQLWEVGEGLQEAFEDIEELAQFCKFRNCRHLSEPGCEVKRAVEEGEIPRERYESYQKLQHELAYLERLQDERAALEEKRKIKLATKGFNRLQDDTD